MTDMEKKDAEAANGNGLFHEDASLPPKPKGWGARHTLAILGFWAFAISYAMRFNLSIAIVAMVNDTKPVEQVDHNAHHHHGHNNFSVSMSPIVREESCSHLALPPSENTGEIDDFKSQGEFHWDSVQQGIILGSFFWGYVLTQLPGGILATKYGGKWTLGIGLFVTAIFTILTPILARTHVYLMILSRVIQGLGEGVTTPAMHAILAAWAPPNERSLLGSIIYAGSQFGTAVTMVVSGYLINGGVMGGWPSVFYFIGGFSVLWFILWVMLMYDTPADHPNISAEELKYIQNSIGKKVIPEPHQQPATPWGEIVKSVPMWAILIAHIGHAYGLYTILTLLPTYLKTVLHFDMKQNSWVSSMPYLVMWIAALCSTQIADLIISRKIMKTVTVRKLCQTIGQIGSAVALIGASYSGCDRVLSVALLTISVGMNGAVYGGYIVNHVDIAPNWAGILMGITNTFANLTGFMAPYVAGILLKDSPSIQNWQYVFFIAAAIYAIDTIVYVLFASSTEQPWNKPKENAMPLEKVQVPLKQQNDE